LPLILIGETEFACREAKKVTHGKEDQQKLIDAKLKEEGGYVSAHQLGYYHQRQQMEYGQQNSFPK
jgi:hypothetical protein